MTIDALFSSFLYIQINNIMKSKRHLHFIEDVFYFVIIKARGGNMDFQKVLLIIFLLGFISINFKTPRFNKRVDELNIIATNIQFTCMLFALLLNQMKIFSLILMLGLLINAYNNKAKNLKPVFFELIILIILPLLIIFDLGIFVPLTESGFTRSSDIYLGLLLAGLVFFLNLYRFSKLEAVNKKYLISFLLLNLILYAENYFLIFKSLK